MEQKEAFVYMWVNNNHEFYVGYHKGDQNDKYISSSKNKKFWTDFENKGLGWERFILFTGTSDECLNYEQKLLKYIDMKSGYCYNRGRGATIIFTNDVRKKMSDAFISRWNNMSIEEKLERNNKISKAQKGVKKPKEMGEHLSKLLKGISFIEKFGKIKAIEIGNKITIANTGKKRTEEFKIGQRNRIMGNNYGAKQSEKTKKMKRDKWLGEKNPNYGKPLSDEVKKKLSDVRRGVPSPFKGIPREQVTCPHCGKVGGEGLMQRWHFDRCKKYEYK